jgi:nucleoside-diphosphate-sugar epimerase
MITIIQLVRSLERILGKSANVEFVDDRKGNFKGRFISSERALKELGWQARHDYQDALSMYVKHYLHSAGR